MHLSSPLDAAGDQWVQEALEASERPAGTGGPKLEPLPSTGGRGALSAGGAGLPASDQSPPCCRWLAGTGGR